MDGFQRKDRTIYVNSILPSATEDDLFSLFSRAGPIEKVIFKNYEGTPQHALVVFRRLESVMFCLDNKDYFKLKGDALGIRALKESRHMHRIRDVPRSAGYDFKKDANYFSFDAASVESFRQRSSESESLNSNTTADSWKSPSPENISDFHPIGPQRQLSDEMNPSDFHLMGPQRQLSDEMNPSDFHMMGPQRQFSNQVDPNDLHLMGPPPPRKFRVPSPLQLPRHHDMDPWQPMPERDFAHPYSAGMVSQGRSAFPFNNNFRASSDIPSWEEFRQMQSPHSPVISPDNLFPGLSPISSAPNNFFGSNFGECPRGDPYQMPYSFDQHGGPPM